jgi:choloylglycine hydrolase
MSPAGHFNIIPFSAKLDPLGIAMRHALFAAIAFLSAASHPVTGWTCTGIKLIAENGSSVHGRTWECGVHLDTSIAVVPRGYAFTGTTPHGPGLSYKARYGAMGVIAFHQPAILDGINEAGLSVGAFHFPGHAQYADIGPSNRKLALSPVEFPHWILTQFATVEEVRAGLNTALIAPTIIRGWGKAPPSFHYIVFDKTGKSLVIEPIGGQLVVYDNKLGVLTNAPSFSWHMNHLRQFVHLAMGNMQSLSLKELELSSLSSTRFSLPGDLTPSARFVRAALISAQIKKAENTEKAVHQAFHLLNQFDIPFGMARDEKSILGYGDYTALMSVRDPFDLKYYFKTYVDPSIRMVDLHQFDLDEPHIKRIRIANTDQCAADISSELE